MIVHVSEELSETMTVRVYKLDFSWHFTRLVFVSASGSDPSINNSYRLSNLCEWVRKVSQGRFHKVELTAGGLTCFIAGSDDDFSRLDVEVGNLIELVFGYPIELVSKQITSNA